MLGRKKTLTWRNKGGEGESDDRDLGCFFSNENGFHYGGANGGFGRARSPSTERA